MNFVDFSIKKDEEEESVKKGKRTKKILSFLLVFAMIFSLNVPVYATESASSGTSTEGEAAKVITGFDTVDGITLMEATEQESIGLPETVTATIEGQADKADVSVNWSCDDYKADANGTYTFIAEIASSGYTLGNGVEMPTVAVEVAIPVADGEEGVPVTQSDEIDGQNSDGKVAKIGNIEYGSLSDAIENAGTEETTIILLMDISESVTIDSGRNIVLDLNGKTLSASSETAITVYGGKLTVEDGTIDNRPSIASDYKSVNYESGKITAEATAVSVYDGGELVVNSGIIESTKNCGIYVGSEVENDTQVSHGIATINGGYVHAREFGVGIMGQNSIFTVNDGVIVADDNAAIGGNGTPTMGGTTMNIKGGTAISHIITSGYIACGIYHPQQGTLNISGGTIYADGGVGVLMRGGKLNMTGGNVIATGTDSGKVGDSEIIANCYGILLDGKAGYYDIVNSKVSISGSSVVQAADAVEAVMRTDKNNITGTVEVSGGTFSSSIDSSYLASGIELQENEDGTFSVCFAEMTIGNENAVKYSDQQRFIQALQSAVGDISIKLLSDVEVPRYIPVSSEQNVNFDLNGHKLSAGLQLEGRHYYAINNSGTLTIIDSAGGGEIYSRGVQNNKDGVLIINSGKIVSCDANGGACVWNEGNVTINGGTFETVYIGTPSDQYGIGCLNNSGTALVTGGTFNDINRRTYAIISTGEIEITPAEGHAVNVHGAHGGLAIDSGTAVVNGGTFSSDDFYGLYVSNDGQGADPMQAVVTVNGGTFSGKTYSVWIGSDYNDPVNSTIEIKDGTFTQPLNAQECTRTGAIAVSGGTFSDAVELKYCADGFIPTVIEDGKYSVKEGSYVATVTDSEGNIKNYESLTEALAALQEGETLTLLADVTNENYSNVISISLPAGATLDGNGNIISGNVAVYVNAAGGTIKNINFQNIHNGTNKLSAVYASGLTGELEITDCEFDTCDWDAIQTTPKAGAVISITGNTFRNTGEQGINTRRYVHVESEEKTDFAVTVTDNKFYDGSKLQETALEVYFPADINKVKLNYNYIDEPMSSCIIINTYSSTNTRPELALPFVDETLTQEIMPAADIVKSTYNNYYYPTLKEAIDAASGSATINLLADVTENVTINAGQNITFKLNDKTWGADITNNGTLSFSGTGKVVSGTLTNNGALTLSCDAVAGFNVVNSGTLKITDGATYDLNKITSEAEGSIVITGGTFNAKPDDSMLAEWYIANPLDDEFGNYKVAKMTLNQALEAGAVASSSASGVTYYKTVSEAVEANNLSAYLQKDVNEDIDATRISTIKDGKIYANGYKLTGSLNIISEYEGTYTKKFCLYADKGGSIELTSAKYSGDLRVYDGNVILNYAEVPSMTVATYNTLAQLTLRDADITGLVNVNASGTLNIEGGKYGTLKRNVYYKQGEEEPTYESVLNVTGGTFDYDMVTVAYTNHTLEDGSTSEQVPLSDYIPEGYEVVANGDGTYTVKQQAVASIGDETYTSLEDAIQAVQQGETIKLLKDVTLADDTSLKIVDKGTEDAPITFDLNGHTILGNNTKTGAIATSTTPGGILWISKSYVVLTDNSIEGEKGGIVNTAESGNVFAIVANSTTEKPAKLTIDGGVRVAVKGSTGASAIHAYTAATSYKAASVTINNAVITSNGYIYKGSTYNTPFVVNDGSFKSELGVGNTSLYNIKNATISGGTFINVKMGYSELPYLAEGKVILFEKDAYGNFVATVVDTPVEGYVAQVVTSGYEKIYLKSGNLYILNELDMLSGKSIDVVRDADFTFPEGEAFGVSSGATATVTLNLVNEAVLSGSVPMQIANVTVTGNGTVSENVFKSSDDTMYEMTSQGENGIYSCSLLEDAVQAKITTTSGVVKLYTDAADVFKSGNLVSGTLDLYVDYETSNRVTITGKHVVLNLNGNKYTYTGTGSGAFWVYSSISGTSSLTINDGVLSVNSDANSAICTRTGYNNTTITIGKDAEITGNTILIEGKNNTLNVYGTIDTTGTKNTPIMGNGSNTVNSIINIYEGAGVKADSEKGIAAIYHPQDGTLNISGGTITGANGIYMKSGTLNVTGGNITGNGVNADYRYENGAYVTTGDAIVLDACGYPGGAPVVQSFTGATVISTNNQAIACYYYEGNGNADIADKNFITGGVFSNDVTEYCETGLVSTKMMDDSGNYTIDTAKYDVVLYSALKDGQVTSVANLTGGGNDNIHGSEITVTAGAINGLVFKGWHIVTSTDGGVISYETDPVSTEATYTFEIKSDTKLVAIYEATKMVTLRVGGSDFEVNGKWQPSGYHNEFAVGTIITVNYVGSNEFSYWKNASDKIMSKTQEYTFRIVDDTDLTPVFIQDSQTGSYVEFISAYDQVMKAEMWYSDDTVMEHALPSGPSKLGGVFKYWSLDGDTEATVESIINAVKLGNSKRITVVPVYEITGNTYTVKIVYPDSSLEEYSGLAEGDIKTVSAKNIDGKEFSYWSTAEQNGIILGYSSNYSVRMSQNITLYAIYDAENVQAVPRIVMTNVFANITDNVQKLSFEATRDVPEGYTIVETGMLYTTQSELSTADKMILNGNGIKQTVSKDINSSQGIFIVNFNVTDHLDDPIFARGYVVVLNSEGNIETYYTDVFSGTYNNPKN